MSKNTSAADTIKAFIDSHECDLFLYSGPLTYKETSVFVDLVYRRQIHRTHCILFLTTPGGDPHAAYRMARVIRTHYATFRLGVFGQCKSAGALVAAGAHELIMAETGELGPLDVQMTKQDELVPNSSGLDIFQSIAVITRSAFATFEESFLQIIERSAGQISTKTAAEIAREFSVGLFAPISAQIDPTRLGEAQRAIGIANDYADRLGGENLRPGAMRKLVEEYPSHGFVIDYDECRKLFKDIRRPSQEEMQIADLFKDLLRHYDNKVNVIDVGAVVGDNVGQIAEDLKHEEHARSNRKRGSNPEKGNANSGERNRVGEQAADPSPSGAQQVSRDSLEHH